MPRYKTLLFDADNTLFDFTAAEKIALSATLEAFDIIPTPSLVTAYSRINDEMWRRLERAEISKEALRTERFAVFCREFGLSASPLAMADTYLTRLSEQTVLIDGALEVCRALAEKCRLYIVTNGILSVQTKRFATSSLKTYFSGVFISEEIGFEKPHRGFFEALERKIPDFKRESTLLIGDSLSSDIKGGVCFGLDTCWFDPHGKMAPADLPITYRIAALRELLPLVL